MPLSPPNIREPLEPLTRRSITCEAFTRADGLFEIEGHLVDQRA
jgi:aryl-alcohol dehydrogenase-like predicted oxidoreductase